MKPNLPSVAAMSPAALLTILLLTYVARADPNPPHDAPAHTDGAAPPPRAPFAWAVCESYKALGPLPLSGVGADPMAALPGRGSFDEMLALASFPSESAVGGAASWRPAVYNASDGVVVLPFPEADGEYEAWAAGEFEVAGTAKGSVVRCSSPAYFRRAGKGEDGSTTRCGADTYEDGRGLCPIKLRKGKYQVFVHVSGDRNETAFLCNFFKDARGLDPPTLLPLNDTIVPDFVVEKSAGGSRVARLAGAHCAVSVMNSDTEEWAVMGKAELRGAPHGLYLAPPPQSSSEEGLPRIAPRQILQLRLDMDVDAGFVELKSVNGSYPTSVSFSVAVSYQLGSDKRHETVFQLEFDVAEWGKSRSYRFTYIDVDGSVQAAAVLPPKFPCIGAAAGRNRCPTILSTHGAGVDALASAWTESYRTQNQSWVLLPTGRRKYGLNWEGPQLKSAITSIRRLAVELPGVPPDEREKYQLHADFWLQSGHSMGGHGALLLSTHYPDMLAAALPAAGWLRVSSYGGAMQREELSFTDAAGRALETLASAEFSADLYAENLLGVPFLARVGSDDVSVPPSNLRRFVRLLKEYEFVNNLTKSVVELNEVPGEGHWFDGVVDDDALQQFLDKNLNAGKKPMLPQNFTLFTMNPASTGSRGGLHILQLETAFEMSRLRVARDVPATGSWQIITENVRRIRYHPVNGVYPRPTRLRIDGSSHAIPVSAEELEARSTHLDFCLQAQTRSRALVWGVCHDSGSWPQQTSLERGPDTAGPSFAILGSRKIVIVYPEHDVKLRDSSVIHANNLYVRGISAQVLPDSEATVKRLVLTADSNVVVIGGPHINRMAAHARSKGYTADVSFPRNDGAFCISTKCFDEAGTGVAFLAGGPLRTLLFFVAGTDAAGMLSAMSFLPSSPTNGIPEFIVIAQSRGWGFKGLGGAVVYGYWNRNWKVEVRKTYPSGFFFEQRQQSQCSALFRSERLSTSTLSFGSIGIALATLLVGAVIYRLASSASMRGYETVGRKQFFSSSAALAPTAAKVSSKARSGPEGKSLLDENDH